MPHYFSEKQDSQLKLIYFEEFLHKQKFRFYTAQGVFSKSRIDTGTRLLIEKSIIKPGFKILDMGCGYGAVGIVMAKAFSADVVMADINERALMLAEKNAKSNGANVRIIKSNLYDSMEDEFIEYFDTVLINPPQKAGKEICFGMIEGSKNFLKKDGILQIVARHKRGGETLSKKMLESFGNLETVARGSGYRIYASRKK